MTEAEKDEFSTALSERYLQIQQYSSYNKELMSLWNEVISDLPLDIKSKFQEKHSRLLAL